MTDVLSGLGVNMQPQFWMAVLEIIWINVLLSGDNAVVIALACRSLPPKQRMYGMIFGTGVALALRLVFSSIVATLMFLPYVKIVGGFALLWIAIKLLTPNEESAGSTEASESLWRAVKLIAFADVVMSLDNVIAVAAVANGNLALLVFGLGISIPAIVAGANIIMVILNYFPLMVWAGAALLGWIAGDLVASDSIVVSWAGTGHGMHEALKFSCAILGVLITVGAGLIYRARQARHA